jgi:hypothetical protein
MTRGCSTSSSTFFWGLADPINGRMLSKNGNRLKRIETLLDALPPGYIFDGEIVALDEDGRPVFNDLLFGRREPVYVAFDILIADGEDVRAAPLKKRKVRWREWFAVIGCRSPSLCWVTARRRSGWCANLTWKGCRQAARGFLRPTDEVVEDPEPGLFAEGGAG